MKLISNSISKEKEKNEKERKKNKRRIQSSDNEWLKILTHKGYVWYALGILG